MRWILALLLSFISFAAMGQDITWIRAGVKKMDIGYSTTAVERAASARSSLALLGPQILPGDTLVLRGEFDFGRDVPMKWPAANYSGEGAVLMHQMMIDKTADKPLGTPGFLVGVDGKSTSFSKIKFVWRCWNKEEDGGGIGWNESGDGNLVFVNCEFDAEFDCDWPIYNWTPGKKTVYIDGGTAKCPRWLVAMADSGSSVNQYVDVRNLKVTLNANGSKTYGESSNADPESGCALAVVLIRGGRAILRNVDVESIGLTAQYDTRTPPKWGCSRIAGLATTRYYSPGGKCDITIANSSSKITPNLSTVWNDIDVRPTDKLKVTYDEAGILAAQKAGLKGIADAAAKAEADLIAARGGSNPDGTLKQQVK
jgi:hypothetical protein